MRRAPLMLALLLASCHQGAPAPAGPGDGATPVGPPAPRTDPASGDPGSGPAAPAPSATLSVADEAGGAGPFLLEELDALALTVRYQHGAPGDHALRIEMSDPGGLLFATAAGTLQADGAGAAATVRSLPVRGTDIERFHRTGRWRLVASIDGQPLAGADVELTE